MRIVRNLLLIGGCILVWLTLLTPFVTGIYLATQSNDNSHKYSQMTTDSSGYTCVQVVTDSSGRCPSNPSYGD